MKSIIVKIKTLIRELFKHSSFQIMYLSSITIIFLSSFIFYQGKINNKTNSLCWVMIMIYVHYRSSIKTKYVTETLVIFSIGLFFKELFTNSAYITVLDIFIYCLFLSRIVYNLYKDVRNIPYNKK